MKKFLMATIIVAVGGYLWWTMRSSEVALSDSGTASAPSESINPTASGSTGTPPGSSSPPPATARYKDGTFTGVVAPSIYGPVQVSVVIKDGKIVTVNVPVYPDDGGNNTAVSNMSIPILKQETIAAQSAKVDIVSGATQTAEAFQQSLASALSQAS